MTLYGYGQARDLTTRLNAGENVYDACAAVGIDTGDLSSEDSSVIDLGDPDNALIDFGWQHFGTGFALFTIHRMSDWVWELRRTTREGGPDEKKAGRQFQSAMDLYAEVTEAIGDVATSFTCGEAELIAEFYRAWGDTEEEGEAVAKAFLTCHAAGDEEGDFHALDADGNVHYRYPEGESS